MVGLGGGVGAGELGGAGGRGGGRGAGVGHVLDRDDDLEVERLADAGVDDLALALRADEELCDPLERALGGRQADPLDRTALVLGPFGDQMVEAFQGQRHVGAALGRRDGVDLVDDHRLDAGEDLAGLAGQHQIQRLGRRDQDVGGLAQHRLAIALRRVAGPQTDRNLGADPRQRGPQVALDVVGERLQRRDVEHLDAGPELLRAAREAVDAPQERGQGLAGPGRGADQRVGAGRDFRPAHCLSGGRALERALEPVPDRLRERRQRIDGRDVFLLLLGAFCGRGQAPDITQGS